MGRDHTLFARVDGFVRYETVGKESKRASVYTSETAS